MTAIYYTPAAALSHDGCGGFLSTITNNIMFKTIKDPKTGITRPSRKIAAKIRDIADGEISAMWTRIKWRANELKKYGKHEQFDAAMMNPDYVAGLGELRAADYWKDGRMIG